RISPPVAVPQSRVRRSQLQPRRPRTEQHGVSPAVPGQPRPRAALPAVRPQAPRRPSPEAVRRLPRPPRPARAGALARLVPHTRHAAAGRPAAVRRPPALHAAAGVPLSPAHGPARAAAVAPRHTPRRAPAGPSRLPLHAAAPLVISLAPSGLPGHQPPAAPGPLLRPTCPRGHAGPRARAAFANHPARHAGGRLPARLAVDRGRLGGRGDRAGRRV
ncbi:hypothetical protein DFJ74DRAFT_774709, partial [Hyaloraphidium curvatum]